MAEQSPSDPSEEANALLSELRKLRDEAVGAASSAKSRAEAAEKHRAAAEKAKAEAEAASGASTASKDKSDAAKTDAEKTKVAIDGLKEQLDQIVANARSDRDGTSKLAKQADEIETKLKGYESELETLNAASKQLHERIEELLPGATGVGLAKSFSKRKDEFARPKKWWAVAFGVSLVSFAVLSFWGPLNVREVLASNGDVADAKFWAEALRGLTWRVPIMIPLVWFAIYASRHHMLSLRLEEEYAEKVAISQSFEGYKREMEAIEKGGKAGTPLETLCDNVLRILGRSPGLIYDKKPEHITPLSVLDDSMIARIEKVAEASKILEAQLKPFIEALRKKLGQ